MVIFSQHSALIFRRGNSKINDFNVLTSCVNPVVLFYSYNLHLICSVVDLDEKKYFKTQLSGRNNWTKRKVCRYNVIGRWSVKKPKHRTRSPWTLLFPDLMTSSPCPRVTAHETLTDLFPQLLVLFDSDVFFSSGLLHCIMGTVVNHQVSTTVALSSIKLSVTTVTDTQVSEGEKKQHHICISSDVRVVGVKVCGVRFSLRLVTTGKGRAGPLKSSWMVRKTKYEHGEQMRPLGGHLRRRRRRKRRFRFYTSV